MITVFQGPRAHNREDPELITMTQAQESAFSWRPMVHRYNWSKLASLLEKILGAEEVTQ